MSQSLPLPSSTKAYTTVSQLLDSVVPATPDDAKSGYFYKKAASDGLFWKTLGAGEVNLVSPGGNLTSFGTSTDIFTGTTITAPSCTKAGTSALAASGTATVTGANTAFGANALAAIPDDTDVAGHTAFGYNCGASVTSGATSVFVGYNNCSQMTSSNADVFIGADIASLSTLASGGANIGIGYGCYAGATFQGNSNIAIGSNTLAAASTAMNNMCIGIDSGQSITTGNSNVLIGLLNGHLITTANNCLALGNNAMTSNVSTTGLVAIGPSSLSLATGTANMGVGYQAGNVITTGTNNLIIGYNANALNGTASNSLIIGNSSRGTGSNEIRIGFGAVQASIQTSCFIDGIFGQTVDAGTGVAAVIDSAGRLGTVVSSKRYKHDIYDVSENTIESLFNMRPVSFVYNSDKTNTPTYGLIAEEVRDLISDIVVYTRDPVTKELVKDIDGKPMVETVQYHLLVPLLIGAIKSLKQENTWLKDNLDYLRNDVLNLSMKMDNLILV